jgi:hypothetical protein
MRKLALTLLLLQPATLFAAADKQNPADFPVKVHVITSASQIIGGGTNSTNIQVLETTIDGQPVELTGGSDGVLALGDYQARIATKIFRPHNPNTYDVYQGYDFLMPDGKIRTYLVTRLGPAPATNP